MIFRAIKIKTRFFLLFLLLTFLVATGVFAQGIIDSAIIVLEKQKENYKIYEQGENYVFEKNEFSNKEDNQINKIDSGVYTEEESFNFNEIGVNWYVILNFSGQTATVYEQDLNWSWQEEQNSLIGKAEFYGCPIELNYFYDDSRQLKAKVSFTNLTDLPIDNLEYRFVAKHSKVLPQESEVASLVDKVKTGEFYYNDNVKIGSISVINNELENKSELFFNMPVGTVAPGESSQIILNLF